MLMASIGQEVNLNVDKNALIIKLVMPMLGTSSTLTIGEWNKKWRVSRVFMWIMLVLLLSCFIANIAGIVYSAFSDPSSWDYFFPWRMSVAVLLNTYLAVVFLLMWYLSLFLPQAPFAVWEALLGVALKGIGMGTTGAYLVGVVLFDQVGCTCTLLAFFVSSLLPYLPCGSGLFVPTAPDSVSGLDAVC